MEKARAASFTPTEQQLLLDSYQEFNHLICRKGNTILAIKEREKGWQAIANRLNATNISGEKRTWQQVKIKYKNILQNVKKKAHASAIGGGLPAVDLTPIEEHALSLHRGRPVLEGIQRVMITDSVPPSDVAPLIQVSGNTVTLSEILDPGEGSSTFEEEESASLYSVKLEDQDPIESEDQPCNDNLQTIKSLYRTHLLKQIELADVKIQYQKRKLQELELDLEIKRKTSKKLDLETQKLQCEVTGHQINIRLDLTPSINPHRSTSIASAFLRLS
ncbi:uncharacterized protein LOC114474792 isoform X2 [Gouania willdenowi]|uniref:uncharacterized protein LOC114474792 isoform X2 n=1 Tax=Gouania willdenowi TaxID=441366 RepID=UPI001054431D|nr:uncharacterized protein LOC114474792 isoform X2 [Gouania willdenowi]